VEKRRIYDVVNILESLNAIFRIEKNLYFWCGLDTIEQTISHFEQGKHLNLFHMMKSKGNKKKMLTSLSAKFIRFFL